ncbi:MAG: 2-hydroxyhepta-2,4-diene,7-dioate isomerase [Actinomycetia bacterium]|nr:2-hydroxyhepta-2,4-diene,7-dioate isomerase [Actinomycetes bacterium]
MRFVNIDGHVHALTGVFDDPTTRAIDLAEKTWHPAEPVAFLAAGGLDAARELTFADDEGVLLSSVRVDPIIPDPRMVWAVGLNYRAHAAETGRPLPEFPALFVKSPGAVIAHDEPIVVPRHVREPDYEGEVAIVIGRHARDVDEADALHYLAGVTIAHDVSARDHQYVTGQFSWSKSFDTFCPLGPLLVTIDEIDVGTLSIETRLNGDVMQSSSTADLVFSVPQLIAWITQGQTLAPGDVILTGTPEGVGAARKPPRFLLDGDLVEITVGGVGTLRNRVQRS